MKCGASHAKSLRPKENGTSGSQTGPILLFASQVFKNAIRNKFEAYANESQKHPLKLEDMTKIYKDHDAVEENSSVKQNYETWPRHKCNHGEIRTEQTPKHEQ